MKSVCLIFAIISPLLGEKSSAAIVVILPTSSAAGSIQVTNDITFTMSVMDSIRAIVFDNWITSGSGSAQLLVTGPLSYRVNSGPVTQNTSLSFSLIDRFTAAPGVLSADDGEMNLPNVIPTTGGDTFTLVAQTLNIPVQSLSINPLAGQAFTGNLFLRGSDFNLLSNVVSAGPIPEPSTMALGLAGLAICFRRQRSLPGV